VFTAYYDESGSPEEHAVAVAGFVATDESWKEFERNWSYTLRQFGISQFHAVDFAHSVEISPSGRAIIRHQTCEMNASGFFVSFSRTSNLEHGFAALTSFVWRTIERSMKFIS